MMVLTRDVLCWNCRGVQPGQSVCYVCSGEGERPPVPDLPALPAPSEEEDV